MLQVCYRCCSVTKQPRIVTKNAPPKEGALMEIIVNFIQKGRAELAPDYAADPLRRGSSLL